MTDMTITLTGETADRLSRLVKTGVYQSAEAALADAIAALEDLISPDLEEWMKTIVSQRYDDQKPPKDKR
jgi:Arc/MetJ-type ribon-helix-helix transcriptional regulator